MPRLDLEITTQINRNLANLDRPDLPEQLAITLARQMYPWLDELLTQLQTIAKQNAERAIDAEFGRAITEIERE